MRRDWLALSDVKGDPWFVRKANHAELAGLVAPASSRRFSA